MMSTEFTIKQERMRMLLEKEHLDALLLQSVPNFAWATCGAAAYVNRSESKAEAALLITRTGRHLITNNIEAPRLMGEEHLDDEWEFHVAPWYAAREQIAELTHGLALGCDGLYPLAHDVSDELIPLRSNLTMEEDQRFRNLSVLCAQAMGAAAEAVRPGQSEQQIAARLGYEAESRGVEVVLNLVGTDERIFNFRHPLPTAKNLERYAMLILCGRQRGLICSLTRLLHFGRLPDDLRRKAGAVAQIDAAAIAATRPGASLGGIFRQAQRTYEQAGFPCEWELHHQGGPAGYLPREVIATPDSTVPVLSGQAFAWNPSITGVKSEDTFLVGAERNEILTEMAAWPCIEVPIDGHVIKRPAILERT